METDFLTMATFACSGLSVERTAQAGATNVGPKLGSNVIFNVPPPVTWTSHMKQLFDTSVDVFVVSGTKINFCTANASSANTVRTGFSWTRKPVDPWRPN